MKSWLHLLLLAALIAGLNLIPAGSGIAQTFTILHRFDSYDGFSPVAELIVSGNTLYGTTAGNVFGTVNSGTVISTLFAVNTDGTGFTNLHSFTGTSNGINSDGTDLEAGLILSGGTLYGTAAHGGSSGAGTVFTVNTNGTGFTNLHNFTAALEPYYTNSDGAGPKGGLILSGNTLYGTASGGGSSGNGTVFAVTTNGTGFTNLHNFTAALDPYYTNSDGAGPNGLILSGNTLYGTAGSGGRYGAGTVFAVKTDGTSFTNLHNFNYPNGVYPFAGLVLSGNTLYGTTSDYFGIDFGYFGTVFSLSFPPPQLTITPSGSNVILSWPVNVAGFDYTGYTLQAAPAITGTLTNLPAATNPYTNPIAGVQQYFRLISN